MVRYSSRKSWENSKSPRKTHCIFLLVCDDKKTSPIYFRNYNDRKSPLIIETPDSGGKDPITLVNYAKELLDTDYNYLKLENGDDVWCVFDRDDTSNESIAKACEIAKENSIKVCFSNPCFEIWFLLHFIDYTFTLGNCNNVISKLKEHIPKYAKNVNYYNDKLKPKTKDAVRRAKKLCEHHEKCGTCLIGRDSDPSTQVYTIIEAISKHTGCLRKD